MALVQMFSDTNRCIHSAFSDYCVKRAMCACKCTSSYISACKSRTFTHHSLNST